MVSLKSRLGELAGAAVEVLRSERDIHTADRSPSGRLRVGRSRPQDAGMRCGPAIWPTMRTASGTLTSAAVTNSGPADRPRHTGTACDALRNKLLATPITGTPNSPCTRGAKTGPPGRVQVQYPSTAINSSPATPGARHAAAAARAPRTRRARTSAPKPAVPWSRPCWRWPEPWPARPPRQSCLASWPLPTWSAVRPHPC